MSTSGYSGISSSSLQTTNYYNLTYTTLYTYKTDSLTYTYSNWVLESSNTTSDLVYTNTASTLWSITAVQQGFTRTSYVWKYSTKTQATNSVRIKFSMQGSNSSSGIKIISKSYSITQTTNSITLRNFDSTFISAGSSLSTRYNATFPSVVANVNSSTGLYSHSVTASAYSTSYTSSGYVVYNIWSTGSPVTYMFDRYIFQTWVRSFTYSKPLVILNGETINTSSAAYTTSTQTYYSTSAVLKGNMSSTTALTRVSSYGSTSTGIGNLTYTTALTQSYASSISTMTDYPTYYTYFSSTKSSTFTTTYYVSSTAKGNMSSTTALISQTTRSSGYYTSSVGIGIMSSTTALTKTTTRQSNYATSSSTIGQMSSTTALTQESTSQSISSIEIED